MAHNNVVKFPKSPNIDQRIEMKQARLREVEIENGKVMITDMLEYITKGYNTMQPEEAWTLVREWWVEVKQAKEYRIAINRKQTEVAKLQAEIESLEQAESKKKWRLW